MRDVSWAKFISILKNKAKEYDKKIYASIPKDAEAFAIKNNILLSSLSFRMLMVFLDFHKLLSN